MIRSAACIVALLCLHWAQVAGAESADAPNAFTPNARDDIVLEIAAPPGAQRLLEPFWLRVEFQNRGHVPYTLQVPLEIGRGDNLELVVRDARGNVVPPVPFIAERWSWTVIRPHRVRLDRQHHIGRLVFTDAESLGITSPGTYTFQAVYRTVPTDEDGNESLNKVEGEWASNRLSIEFRE